ncbi:unnamed protein product [Cyprideis torosa]|uniref:Uncharacterized protein n=1 Tax=Cyprideis torosa TaxID=163714 RepID=A0A7R8WCX9_9CRUS|nr:unnamed protein product [Cyprideis torosa]CAG0893949.1 unnamed protein product [Cyprideis torosa]
MVAEMFKGNLLSSTNLIRKLTAGGCLLMSLAVAQSILKHNEFSGRLESFRNEVNKRIDDIGKEVRSCKVKRMMAASIARSRLSSFLVTRRLQGVSARPFRQAPQALTVSMDRDSRLEILSQPKGPDAGVLPIVICFVMITGIMIVRSAYSQHIHRKWELALIEPYVDQSTKQARITSYHRE